VSVRPPGRSACRNRRRGRERGRPRLGPCGHRHGMRDSRRDHGHQHLPHRPGRQRARDPRRLRCRSGRRHSRSVRYEAGQSAVGDIFAWFVEQCVPPVYHDRARERGVSVHEILEEDAARLAPANRVACARLVERQPLRAGRRRSLGILFGMTLATTAPEIYRALIEATAFGTRVIIDAFEKGGVRIDQVVACGGLPERNRMLMQIYADATGRAFRIAASPKHGSWIGDVCRGRRGTRVRRLRLDRGRRPAHGASPRRGLRADRGQPRCYDLLFANTSGSTICSGVAAIRR